MQFDCRILHPGGLVTFMDSLTKSQTASFAGYRSGYRPLNPLMRFHPVDISKGVRSTATSPYSFVSVKTTRLDNFSLRHQPSFRQPSKMQENHHGNSRENRKKQDQCHFFQWCQSNGLK